MSSKKPKEFDLYHTTKAQAGASRVVRFAQDDGGRSLLLIFERGDEVRRVRINRRLMCDLIAAMCNANDVRSMSYNSRTGRVSVAMVGDADAREVTSFPAGWERA